MSLKLDARQTALIVIDPQNWTLGMPLAPWTAQDVVGNVVSLARAIGPVGHVILTRAAFSDGYADALRTPVDLPLSLPDGGIPEAALAFNADVAAVGCDVTITKRQWSAFYGTELDLQLRRRGITTIVLAGVMTNFGVESTARDAWQHNYAVVVAEDACSSLGPDLHAFSMTRVMPRISRVRTTAEIVAALQ
ncbi:hydrolase [Pandoraea anhela]|uniref:Hydrolase n=1 Tax=Pandoraea anhela TaxID=2508295 RepID=A0A5E4WB25_9BURK|nr:hydrolase [Pandoraea anhela]VVE21788.1 hydrolase [Pandoraea anhela]